MPYITRSTLAVSKDTNSRHKLDLLSTFGATELGFRTLGSPPAAARNTLDLAPTEPQPFPCRCARPCTPPTLAATLDKSITIAPNQPIPAPTPIPTLPPYPRALSLWPHCARQRGTWPCPLPLPAESSDTQHGPLQSFSTATLLRSFFSLVKVGKLAEAPL